MKLTSKEREGERERKKEKDKEKETNQQLQRIVSKIIRTFQTNQTFYVM